MSTEKLKLEVLLALTDKVLKPLKGITGGSNETAKALKATKDQLKQLNDAQKRIDGFRKIDKDLSIVKNGMKGAQDRIKGLKAEIAKLPAPTKDMARALKEAQAEASQLKGRYAQLLEKQQRLRTEFNASGMETRKLATHQRELAEKIKATNAAIDQQNEAMERQKAQAQRIHAAQANYQKAMAWHGKLTQAGRMTIGAGLAGGLPIVQMVRQYASFEDAMLGVARQVDGTVDANGKYTATYYEMADSIKALSERLPMAATEIAALVEAGARMGIQGKQDLLAYTETTIKMATAFQLPVEQIGDSMATVAQLYKVPIDSISSLGDAINWLDDNSKAKGPDIIEVLQRIGGTATTLHMSYKEAAALGSTFLSLGAGAEVAASASEAMMKQLAIATMLPKRFQAGMAMIGMNSKAVQDAMGKDAMGTIVKVMEAINKLPQNQRIEAATRLFGKEFGPDASKLAGNLDELRRQLAWVNEEKSKGSMDREMAKRLGTLTAAGQMTKNTVGNLAAELGEKLKPELMNIIFWVRDTLQGVRDWTKAHPGLTGALLKTAAILAVVVTAVGALIFAAGALIAPIALLRLNLTMLGIKSAALGGGLWSLIKPVAAVVLAFSAGCAAGTLMLDWIDRFVSRIMGSTTTLGAAIFDIVQLFRNGEWAQIGMLIIKGIYAGLDAYTGGLLGKVGNIATRMIAAAKSAFGIRSPSTVFAAIGEFTMSGLSNGIQRAKGSAIGAMAQAARNVTAAGAGMLIGSTAMAQMPADAARAIIDQHQGITLPEVPDAVRWIRDAYLADPQLADAGGAVRRIRDAQLPEAFGEQRARVSNALDTRPPLAAGAPAGVSISGPINIVIQQLPGQSAQDLAQEVRRQIESLGRAQQARLRSRLGDRE